VPIAQRAALFVLALACGCAATGPAPPTTPAEKPPITIAVLGLGGSDAQASAVEDGCVMALLEAGYRIVERPRVVAAIPNENDVDYTAAGWGQQPLRYWLDSHEVNRRIAHLNQLYGSVGITDRLELVCGSCGGVVARCGCPGAHRRCGTVRGMGGVGASHGRVA